MEYDCSSSPLTTDYKFDPEKPDQISGLGTIAIDPITRIQTSEPINIRDYPEGHLKGSF